MLITLVSCSHLCVGQIREGRMKEKEESHRDKLGGGKRGGILETWESK